MDLNLNSQCEILSTRTSFASLNEIDFSKVFHDNVIASMQMNDGSKAPVHLETDITSCWNESSLFVFFCGRFEKLRTAERSYPIAVETGKTLQLWEQSDVFELFIGVDAKKTKRYKEFQVAPDGRWLDASITHEHNVMNADFKWHSGFHCRSEIDQKKKLWYSAMEIPWKGIEIEILSEEKIQCNFYRASGPFHGEELLAWSPPGIGDQCFHRVESFRSLKFV